MRIWSKLMGYLGLDHGTAPAPQTGADLVEYRVVAAPAEHVHLEAALNNLAADGWKLVQILPLPHEETGGYEPISGQVSLVMRRAAVG